MPTRPAINIPKKSEAMDDLEDFIDAGGWRTGIPGAAQATMQIRPLLMFCFFCVSLLGCTGLLVSCQYQHQR
jgi:hypothetical protein